MTARWLFRVALLISLAAAAANADEVPARVFHIGIVAGTARSNPEHAAFEERLRELGYIEGRNLTIDFVQDNDLDRLVAAVGEFARRGVRFPRTRRTSPEVPVTASAYANSSSSAFAFLRSGVSKPSVNQPDTDLKPTPTFLRLLRPRGGSKWTR
jgi:hypothetical protein